MQNLVVDASVAVKWIVAEVQTDIADGLLAADLRHIAPDLILVEVANALRKKVLLKQISLEQARQALQELPDMFVDVINSAALTSTAFNIAVAVNHPVADCVYIALADSLDAKFVTADIRMIERFAGTRHAARIVSLAEFGQVSINDSNPNAKH